MDGTHSRARMVSSQPEKDIAVLQAETLPQLFVPGDPWERKCNEVGDDAYVVGNPFGLYSSMSAGVISGFDRYLPAAEYEASNRGTDPGGCSDQPWKFGRSLAESLWRGGRDRDRDCQPDRANFLHRYWVCRAD